ncbi:MAG: hypothetical protein ACPLY9_06910 [Nitrososphaerales archaeon]
MRDSVQDKLSELKKGCLIEVLWIDACITQNVRNFTNKTFATYKKSVGRFVSIAKDHRYHEPHLIISNEITDEEIHDITSYPFRDNNEILVEGVGKDTKDALNILSMAGLNEAFLFLRHYKELSNGQKYRYKIAKMLDSKKNTWVMDEFCSTLDRITAKVVSYCVQKVVRKQGKTVLVATTHDDLLYDLNPNHIEKRFGYNVQVNYYKYEPRGCSILKDILIEEGSVKDYKKLEHFHYRSSSLAFTKKIYVAKIKDELVGIIVYGYLYFHLKARNCALPQYSGKITKDKMAMINRDILRIWMVIVLPKYRSIGLGVKLVKETLPLVNVPCVETIAIMAKYNPFFEKAGMIRINVPETERDRSYRKNLERLENLGFNLDLLSSKEHNLMIIVLCGLNFSSQLFLINILCEGSTETKCQPSDKYLSSSSSLIIL